MWTCKNCGSDIENDDFLSCWSCGFGKDGSPPADKEVFEEAKRNARTSSYSAPVSTSSGFSLETKYPALRVIAVIFKILAVLAAIAGLIGALVGLTQMSGKAPEIGGVLVLVSLLYGGLGCLYLLAISEGIRVFIDIEVNTRLSNELLRKLLEK